MARQNESDPLRIALHGVVKSFVPHVGSSVRPTIGPLDLEVAAGECIAIVGRSGVGKSTVLRLFAGPIEADDGEPVVGDESARAARDHKLLGFMPQSPALLPWKTVRNNVGLLAQLNRERGRTPMTASDALEIVGLADVADSLPQTLSGGMRQRVALARTLATNAPVLLLDEPFSALDETTRLVMHDHLRSLRISGRYTIVFVTHDLREAAVLADRVVVLAGHPAAIAQDLDTTDIDGSDPVHTQEVVEQLRSQLGAEGAA